jgi:hypothetical protein
LAKKVGSEGGGGAEGASCTIRVKKVGEGRGNNEWQDMANMILLI